MIKTCVKGHQFNKTSNCPTCPVCEKERKPKYGFLALISAPARRALESKNICTLQQLSKFTEKQILAMHGIGPSSIPVLKAELKKAGLQLRDN